MQFGVSVWGVLEGEYGLKEKGLYSQQSKFQITVNSGLECDLDLEVEIEPQAEGVALAAAVATAAALLLEGAAGHATKSAGSTADEALCCLTGSAAEKAVSHAAERAATALLLLDLLLLAATLLGRLGRHILLFAFVLVGELCGLGLGLATAAAAAAS